MMKKHYYGAGRPVYMDPHKELVIGGGAYSLLSQQGKDKIFAPEPVKLSEQAKNIKQAIEKTAFYWLMLYKNYDSYGITPGEYFEIAKLAIDLYPHEMHHLRNDKLTANQYYDVCAIMAKHGVFDGVNYDKLIHAHPDGVTNPLYKIMFSALIKSAFVQEDDIVSTEPFIMLSAMRENSQRFKPHEKHALSFALWVFMKPQDFGKNISGDDLVGITDKTVEYVKNIIIREIYKSPNSDFVYRLNFPSVMIDENNGMPRNVNEACRQIVDAIYDGGQKRIDMKEKRRER